MVNVNKKYIKIAVGGLAVSILVIGLSVGLTAKNKNSSNLSASNASENALADFDENAAEKCIDQQETDGPTLAPKAGKSGGSRRRLVVPGTEEYVVHVTSGKGGQLRNELTRSLKDPPRPKSQRTRMAKAKSQKARPLSGKAVKEKVSGKAVKEKEAEGITDICMSIADLCNDNGESAKDTDKPSKLSGKSGRRKLSGKSGAGAAAAVKINCDGEIGGSPIGGKSGGRRKLSGKSGANAEGSIVGIDENCVSPPPSICEDPSPAPSASVVPTPKKTKPPTTSLSTPSPVALLETPEPTTPAPTVPCNCSAQQWISFNGQCYHGCGFSCETLPSRFGTSAFTCNEGFKISEDCCESLNLSAGDSTKNCIAEDQCPPIEEIVTPPPSPEPTSVLSAELTLGSTPTVSADVTGPPTTKDRPPTTGSPESV